MADLSKLSPAPWQVWHDIESGSTYIRGVPGGPPILLPEFDDASCYAALEFAALARNALDVMVRREWVPVMYCDKTFGVQDHHVRFPTGLGGQSWPDPFTALVEADRWYRENVEAQT